MLSNRVSNEGSAFFSTRVELPLTKLNVESLRISSLIELLFVYYWNELKQRT